MENRELANLELNFPSLFWKTDRKNKTKSPWFPSLAARVVSPIVNPTYKGSWLPAEPRSTNHISEDTR